MSDQIKPMGEFFDSVAHDYDVVQVSNIDRGEEYYRELADPVPWTSDTLRMLDIGAGTGLDLVAILARAPNMQVDCLDVSRELLGRLQDRFPEGRLNIREENYLDAPFPPGYYDFILASATLHHLTPEEKRGVFLRLADTLKPSGTLIVGDFYVEAPISRLFRDHYQSITDTGVDVSRGSYHLDIPVPVEDEVANLNRAGFADVSVHWRSDNYAILVGKLSSI